MPRAVKLWTNPGLLRAGVDLAAEQGYAFVHNAITGPGLRRFEHEVGRLCLEFEDRVERPIHSGTKHQITQQHDRAYHAVGDPQVPVATLFANKLAADIVRGRRIVYPELAEWGATEAGYQLYSGADHHISKHRDRRSDQLLAVTLTIAGWALVGVHEPLGDPDDYTNTRELEVVETGPGTVMFLRAPGLGNGDQVIHEVSPPTVLPRAVLNLRMRPDILLTPTT